MRPRSLFVGISFFSLISAAAAGSLPDGAVESTFQAIPEPAIALLGALGFCLLLFRRNQP